MRLAALLIVALACAGCRRGPDGPVDPTNPDLAACPAGAPHVVVGVQALQTDMTQAIARYTAELTPCRGAALPFGEHGTISAVAALADGADLVGFYDDYSYGGGTLARVEGDAITAQVVDEEAYPISIAPLTFQGQRAVAVVWGTGGSNTYDGERIEVFAEAGLASLARFPATSELMFVAAPPSGQAERLAGLIAEGLQEYRPELDALATTGELQVALPLGAYYRRTLDVRGQDVRIATREGVLSWRTGSAPAFLGPVACRWPDTVDTPLPAEGAEYKAAAIDPRAPADTLVAIEGELEGGSESTSHLFVLRPRGECLRVASMSSGYRAVAIAASR